MKQPIALSRLIALAFAGTASIASAQTGTPLQGTTPVAPVPTDSRALPQFKPGAAAARVAPGGAQVEVKSVVFSGNQSIASEALMAELGDVTGKRFDMEGLTGLADRLGTFYRRSGYPFAQVILPPQDLTAGTLRVQVIEGRYGKIRAAGKDELPAGAQPFLDFGLSSGAAIYNKQLERTMLILDDQPGNDVYPVLQPGTNLGDSDLTVNVVQGKRLDGEVGFDNTGNTNTGEYRLRGALNINSPFIFGDKIALNALRTNEGMWLGSIDYERPLGPSGLRGSVGYARTSYELGGQFAALGASGISETATLRLSYPLVRSQATNVIASIALVHKDLEDRPGSGVPTNNKSSNGVPLTLQFDNRDTLLGGGVTFGALSVLNGNLQLNAAAAALDSGSANTAGRFGKITLDAARIQSLPMGLSAYARFSGQWATNRNLDSSEKFNLGGFHGVRAYPLGEGTGDEGWLAQLEVRYAAAGFTPFVFHDLGKSDVNIKPWDAASAATRSLAGSGVGVRAAIAGFNVESTLSWRSRGGVATADDTADRNPRFYFMVGRKF